MEQQKYLIDTNAIIDYLGNRLPISGLNFMNSIIDNIPTISVISKIEVLGFTTTDKNYSLLKDFIDDSFVLDLTENVIDTCIEIRKNHKTKLPDAIIASTAIANNLILITRNVSDFKNIDGLQVVNPHSL
ncbi:MAG: type II toxin-antitoxin system VapC family toxin [Crocinitomicaceae bacterium]|nr:type II toxin-antitoxin system VapC family toxin [Crocinitomicaceae bacterium]